MQVNVLINLPFLSFFYKIIWFLLTLNCFHLSLYFWQVNSNEEEYLVKQECILVESSTIGCWKHGMLPYDWVFPSKTTTTRTVWHWWLLVNHKNQDYLLWYWTSTNLHNCKTRQRNVLKFSSFLFIVYFKSFGTSSALKGSRKYVEKQRKYMKRSLHVITLIVWLFIFLRSLMVFN